MNLITDAWIPVYTKSGQHKLIRPDEIAAAADPPVRMAWARPSPDFNLAALEFLIGLFFAASAPQNEEEWHENQQPAQESLRKTLARLSPAFNVDGNGPRFMQSPPLDEQQEPLRSLFLDGERNQERAQNEVNLNPLRAEYKFLSPGAAALTLFMQQAWAVQGGRGYYASLRGGGPWITLAYPNTGRWPTLWEIVWANVPNGVPVHPDQLETAFPWMQDKPFAVTEVSQTEALSAETFFAMPRCVRLVFEPLVHVCPITQQKGNIAAVGFHQKSGLGRKYPNWTHPLTPHRKVEKGGKASIRHRKCSATRISYVDWPGLTLTDPEKGAGIATSVAQYNQRNDRNPCHLLLGGWAVDKNSTLLFVWLEHKVPLRNDVHETVLLFVKAGETTCYRLKGKLGKLKAPDIPILQSEFYGKTEDVLKRLLGLIYHEPLDALKEKWIAALRKTALDIFDRVLVAEPLDNGDLLCKPEEIIQERRSLHMFFKSAKPTDLRAMLKLPTMSDKE